MAAFRLRSGPLLACAGLGTWMSLPPSVTETKGRFTGKTVVITGGGGTFGKVGAQYFAKEGANVVLLDFNKAALDASVESVKNSSSSNIVGVLCNVTDVDDVAAAVFRGPALELLRDRERSEPDHMA